MKRFLLLLAACIQLASGHNMPNSLVSLDFQRNRVDAELTLPLQELEFGYKKPLLADPVKVLAEQHDSLAAYVEEHIHPVAPDGRPWSVKVTALRMQLSEKPFDLIANVTMTPPPGASSRKFRFNYSVINHEVMTHYAAIVVRSDWDNAVFSDKPEPLGMLQFVVTYLDIDRTRGSWTRGFRSVFRHGMSHIADGVDHLLFLFTLLLPAPLLAISGRWKRPLPVRSACLNLLKIITSFTLGHSLTLALAGFGIVTLPSQPVEILVAFSILVSAVHAVRPIFPGRESWIAAGFGLVHGLAFASTIAHYGFSTYYMGLTLLAFNLGIEIMQLFIMACLIPWLMIASRSSAYSWLRITGAVFAAAASIGWIVNRSIGWRNPLESTTDWLATHGTHAVSSLAAVSLAIYFFGPKADHRRSRRLCLFFSSASRRERQRSNASSSSQRL
ncbi:MAG: HupE/UreJ family protein [Luteolibacter sp.]